MGFLKGKKTHIIAILMFVVALLKVLDGDITWVQFFNSPELLQMLAAFGLSSLRAGVAKSEPGK